MRKVLPCPSSTLGEGKILTLVALKIPAIIVNLELPRGAVKTTQVENVATQA